MKKLLIGCGVVVLLIFCFVVGVGIWGVNKLKTYQKGIEQVKAAYEATNRSFPFTAPNPPVMQPARFQKYLAVRAALAKALEADMNAMKGPNGSSPGSANAKREPSFSDIVHLAGLPKRLGTAHVKALQEQSMSVDEYLWYSKIVLGTILKAMKEGKDVAAELTKAYGDLGKQGAIPPPPGNTSASPPSPESAFQVSDVPLLEENLKLVNSAKDELSKYPQTFSIDLFLRQFDVGKPIGTSPYPSGSSRTGSAQSPSQNAPMARATPIPNH